AGKGRGNAVMPQQHGGTEVHRGANVVSQRPRCGHERACAVRRKLRDALPLQSGLLARGNSEAGVVWGDCRYPSAAQENAGALSALFRARASPNFLSEQISPLMLAVQCESLVTNWPR
ncbi:unnamed protein product, partial [Symbiodinium sp. CCMP2592]